MGDVTPFDSSDLLVNQQFQDFLGRAPTLAETTTWVAPIATCASDADDLIVSLVPTDQKLDDARLLRLYIAFFKRPPDPTGFAYWQHSLDVGRGLVRAATKFAQSTEFKRVYGSLTNTQFVDLVYQNVLGRPGDPTGRTFWIKRLDNHTKTRGDVMVNFSESSENLRTERDHVDVFRLYRAMLQKFPTKSAYFAILDPITASTDTLADAAQDIRHSASYAARV